LKNFIVELLFTWTWYGFGMALTLSKSKDTVYFRYVLDFSGLCFLLLQVALYRFPARRCTHFQSALNVGGGQRAAVGGGGYCQ